MTNLILTAAHYAKTKHDATGKVRKFTGKPYIIHPARVAARATAYFSRLYHGDHARWEQLVAAGWLHDVPEDCYATPADGLQEMRAAGFPAPTVDLCDELTKASKGKNELQHLHDRKRLDREKLLHISHDGKCLKMLDRLENIEDSVYAPYDFVNYYFADTDELLEVIGEADPVLAEEIRDAMRTLRKRHDEIRELEMRCMPPGKFVT